MKMFTQTRHLIILILSTSLWIDASAQTPTRELLGAHGPYQVAYYSNFPVPEEFRAGTIYFPANKGLSFGAVAISPGFMERQENMSWWGNHLASETVRISGARLMESRSHQVEEVLSR